jgi:hypothetical protein
VLGQILEYLASSIQKEDALFQVMVKCMDNSIKEMEEYFGEGSAQLAECLTRVNKKKCDESFLNEYEKNDSRKLYKMHLGGIPSSEPEFAKKKSRFLPSTCLP